MPASAVAAIQKVGGVAEVQGNVVNAQGQVSVVGKDGKALSTNAAPIIAGNWIDSARLNQQKIIAGQAPRGPTEVLLDGRLAEKAGVTVGQDTTVFLPTGQQQVKVVGLVQYLNGKDTLGGESYVYFTTEAAQKLLHVNGYSDVVVAGRTTGSRRPSCATGSLPRCPAAGSRHRHPAGRRAGQRRAEGHRLPQHVPARVRVGGAVRRGVHHLQHVLDPGRAADPRAAP